MTLLINCFMSHQIEASCIFPSVMRNHTSETFDKVLSIIQYNMKTFDLIQRKFCAILLNLSPNSSQDDTACKKRYIVKDIFLTLKKK